MGVHERRTFMSAHALTYGSNGAFCGSALTEIAITHVPMGVAVWMRDIDFDIVQQLTESFVTCVFQIDSLAHQR